MDEAVVALVHAGDLGGLSALFDRHGAACLQAATSAAGERADPQALVFEVFLAAWRTPPPATAAVREFLVAQTVAKAREMTGELSSAD